MTNKFNSVVFMKSWKKFIKSSKLVDAGLQIASVGMLLVGVGVMKMNNEINNAGAYTVSDNSVDKLGAAFDEISDKSSEKVLRWSLYDANELEK